MPRRSVLRDISFLSLLLVANCPGLRTTPLTTYRIGGIVADSVTGQPLEGAEVTIAPVTALDDAQTYLTSSGGRFSFANLPAGKYRLMASRRGYATHAFHEHEAFSTAIVVGPGLDSEHIRFPLIPSSLITGVVTDEWGDAVRDARVLLFQQSMFDGSRTLRNVNQTMTDDQGRYRFAHLLSSTYAVAVYTRPWYTQAQGQYAAFTTEHPETSEDIVLGDASQPSLAQLFDVVYPVTFFPGVTTLAEAGRFANQGESSAEAIQMNVSPDIALSLKIGEGYTDELDPIRKEIAPGLIELSGIPRGEINMAMASFRGSVLNPDGLDYASRAKTLNVSGDTEVDFSSQGGPANVSGAVLSSQFHPARANAEQPPGEKPSTGRAALMRVMEAASSSVTITFRSLKTSESYDAAISSEGKFSFTGSPLPAGPYEVEFAAQTGLHVGSLEATGATVSGRTIEIPAGQPVNIVVHAAEANCTLSGFALKNGKPVAGAMVLLVPQDPGHDMSLYHRDQSDSDGSFSMSPLFPGRYILLAIENGWDLEWADPKVMFQYLPASQPLELKPGASLTLNAKVQ